MTREERVNIINELACDDCDRGLFSNNHVCQLGHRVLRRLDVSYLRNGMLGEETWTIAELTCKNGDKFQITGKGELYQAFTKQRRLDADDLLQSKHARRVDNRLKSLLKEVNERELNSLKRENKQ